jgi:uncharacterized protein (DUF4415 family)
MSKNKRKQRSEGFTAKDLKEVSDNPRWTRKSFAEAKPFGELFPQLAESIKRGRGRPKLETPKEAIKLRLDADVLAAYRATGDGWQTKINADLRKARKLRTG